MVAVSSGSERFGASEFYDLGVQTNGLLDQRLLGAARRVVVVFDFIFVLIFVLHQRNFGAEKCALFIHLEDFEAIDATSKNIHAAVVILFCDGKNFGGAADAGDAFVGGANDAKGFFLLQAFGDHFFIARLEDVERERGSGEQDQIERE